MAAIFIILLASTLIMLPLTSKQNRSALLNTVEEEAGGGNNLNEEHKHGKSIHANFLDFAQQMQLHLAERVQYEVPLSVDINSFRLCERIIQPPDC